MAIRTTVAPLVAARGNIVVRVGIKVAVARVAAGSISDDVVNILGGRENYHH